MNSSVKLLRKVKVKAIEVKCTGTDFIELSQLQPFQKDLKKLKRVNFEKLRKSIIQKGFIAPFFIWKDKDENKLLDGHQRMRVLKVLQKEGYEIPLLPCIFIEANSEADAKEKLLHITSQFGSFFHAGTFEFIKDLDMKKLNTVKLPGFNFDKISLKDDLDSVKKKKAVCPACGKVFYTT